MSKTIEDLVREQVDRDYAGQHLPPETIELIISNRSAHYPEYVAAVKAAHPDATTRWKTATARDCMEEMHRYMDKHIAVTGKNPLAYEVSSHLQRWLAQTEVAK